MDKPVYFRDLMPTSPLKPTPMTQKERGLFVREVEKEMDRLGFTQANRITAQSEIMTGRDYAVTINCRRLQREYEDYDNRS